MINTDKLTPYFNKYLIERLKVIIKERDIKVLTMQDASHDIEIENTIRVMKEINKGFYNFLDRREWFAKAYKKFLSDTK
mgnify:CR=1 FL=1